MSLNRDVLPFDKEFISEEEVLEHVQYYYDLAEKGMELLKLNKSEALKCLKEIRKTMSLEYKYYTKRKLQNIMWDNHVYNQYYHYIQDAFVKQNNPNSHEKLSSNLYDVWDYTKYYYCKKLIIK